MISDSKKTPVDRNIIDTVIQHRTKEFSAKQQEAVLQAKYVHISAIFNYPSPAEDIIF